MNRNWYTLLGNWLGGAAQTKESTTNFGYGDAPESPHIMWAKPMLDGGTMDQRFGDRGYYTGLSYEGFGSGADVILNGRVYYNVMSPPRFGWWALDLYTGEKLFFHNTTGPMQFNRAGDGSGYYIVDRVDFGQILNYESPNQHGGLAYLWSTGVATSQANPYPEPNTWSMFDAYTGNLICKIANVSATGTSAYGKEGSILRYNIATSGSTQRLTIWNTTHAIQEGHNMDAGTAYIRNWYWVWRPTMNYVFDGRKGFSLNVTITQPVTGSIRVIREDEYLIGGTEGSNDEKGITLGQMWCLSLKPGQEGRLLWNRTFTPPSSAGNKTVSLRAVDPENKVFIFSCTQTRIWWAYSLETGTVIWQSRPESQWNYYGMSFNIYQGKLITYGYGGELIAYNIADGRVAWNYTASNVGFESPYGNYPLSLACVADGKIYMYSTEHSPTMPLWRGSYLRCIDASNGREIWKISHWGGVNLGDGYLVGLNLYDNRIYCYGKGPSALTVTAPDAGVALGTSVVIKGTLTDQSPDGKNTPAIADENMQAWMEYLYMQQGKPASAKGLPVKITATDPNGNYQDVGTTISDSLGNFAIEWTPPVSGLYKIKATFAGSNSYYGSEAGTAFAVSKAPTPAPVVVTPAPTQPVIPAPTAAPTAIATPEPTATSAPLPPTSNEPAATYIVIGAAIVIIVVAAAALVLRRRK